MPQTEICLSTSACADSNVVGTPCTIGFIPNAPFIRYSIKPIARCVTSIPIHFRFRLCAACTAVPHPQNGSNIISPSLEEVLIIRSSNDRGF